MPVFNNTQDITLTAGGGTVNLDTSDNVNLYVIKGTATLTANWTIQPTDTNSILTVGTEYNFKYEANITLDGNDITIFGQTLPPHLADKKLNITAYYNGTAWEVTFVPNVNQTNFINYDDVIGLSTDLTAAKNFMIAVPFDFEGTGQSELQIPLSHFQSDMYLKRVDIKITQALSATDNASFTVLDASDTTILRNFIIPLSSTIGYSDSETFNELIPVSTSAINLNWKKNTTGGRGIALIYFSLK